MVSNRYSRFTIGELDPLMLARNDLEIYYSALDKCRNVAVLPEGGAKRRPGSVYIDRLSRQITRETAPTITAPNGGTGANANDDDVSTELLTTTAIGTNNPYVVVHYDLGAATNIAFVDVVGGRLSTGDSAEFFIQVSTDNAVWFTVGSSVNLSTSDTTQRRRVRGSYRYIRFARIGATDLGAAVCALDEFHVWREEEAQSAARLIEFKFNIDQSYILALTDKNMAVYRDRVYKADIRTVTTDAICYDNAKMETLNWTRTGDTLILLHEDVPPHSVVRQGSDFNWSSSRIVFDYIPKYDFNRSAEKPATTLTPSAVSGKITLTSGANAFTAADVDQIIEGNGGRARVVAYTSATVVEAIVEIPFYNTDSIPSGDWEIQRGWEDVWSADRGYPRSGCFFQDRLWFGGSKTRVRTLWGSVIGDYYNFNPGSGRDTDAIDRDLETEDSIINMLAHRTLQIFTTGSESAAVQARGTALTPSTPGFLPQTEMGSAIGLRPVVSNGVILFVQRGGKSISQMVFSDVEQAFTSTNISLFSSHLIRTPVDFNIRRSTNVEEGNYLLIVNSDGTLAVSCLLLEENVRGFSLWTTDGLYKNVAVDDTDVYTVVEREIGGITNRNLEVFDYDHLMDASIKYSTGFPTDTFTDLEHLNGYEASVMVDGYNLPDQTVTGGEITTSTSATSSAEIGINFTPLIKTLAFENPQNLGETMGSLKNIYDAYVWISNTGEVFINDILVSLEQFGGVGDNPLDVPPAIRTGIYRVPGSSGWDEYGQVTLTQENPQPLTVLGIRVNAKVGS